jgi:hypothetical protein
MMNLTKEQLMEMPLNKLKLIDISSKEEEALVQAVINLKTIDIPPQTTVYNLDVPDIKTSEEEAKWQKIMDDRRAGLKPQVEVKSDASGIEIKVEQAEVKTVVANKCDKCDFVGKNANGLRLHSKKHIIKPLVENK